MMKYLTVLFILLASIPSFALMCVDYDLDDATDIIMVRIIGIEQPYFEKKVNKDNMGSYIWRINIEVQKIYKGDVDRLRLFTEVYITDICGWSFYTEPCDETPVNATKRYAEGRELILYFVTDPKTKKIAPMGPYVIEYYNTLRAFWQFCAGNIVFKHSDTFNEPYPPLWIRSGE